MCADTNQQGVSAPIQPEKKCFILIIYYQQAGLCSLFISIKTVLIETMLPHFLQISPLL